MPPVSEPREGTLRELLRRARDEGLPSGWLYLRDAEPTLETRCLFLDEDEGELDERGIPRVAAERGFPFEALEGPMVEDVIACARRLHDPPGDDLMLESFLYCLEYDAFLPSAGAHPPPRDVARRESDRELYDSLGPEQPGTRCAQPGCPRGAIAHGILCRAHHFEMVKNRACPFGD